jgi:gas vesicle protein
MLFLDESPTSMISGFGALWGLLIAVVTIGTAAMLLMASRKSTVSTLQVQRADAAEGLLKTKETEIQSLSKKCQQCSEELEDTTAELRGQMAINVDQLMAYWQIRDGELAKISQLEERVRVLQRAVEQSGSKVV